MDLVILLLDRYQLPDPVIDDTIGAFTDPGLGALYTSLVATGQTSLEQALWVGATIEDLDLADLYGMIDLADNPDIRLIAHNLAKGSRNHFRAFAKVRDVCGYDPYTAQYLDQSQVDAIIASEPERAVVYDEMGDVLAACGGGGNGRGNGRIQGKRAGGGTGCCAGSGS